VCYDFNNFFTLTFSGEQTKANAAASPQIYFQSALSEI